jgi:hypothetical protein
MSRSNTRCTGMLGQRRRMSNAVVRPVTPLPTTTTGLVAARGVDTLVLFPNLWAAAARRSMNVALPPCLMNVQCGRFFGRFIKQVHILTDLKHLHEQLYLRETGVCSDCQNLSCIDARQASLHAVHHQLSEATFDEDICHSMPPAG